jgi:hypothetical protein
VKKSSRLPRANNANLPDGAHDHDRFRRNFISTAVSLVASLGNAWKVEDKVAVPKFQKIWDTIYGSTVPYTIEVNDAVYSVVRGNFPFYKVLLIFCLQTMQRVSDTWRSRFGSTAMHLINSFFSSDETFDTDESRQDFAKEAIRTRSFLYADTTSPNRKVCMS